MESMEKARVDELVKKVGEDIRTICEKPAGMDVIERLLGMVIGQLRATVDLMPKEGTYQPVSNPAPESIGVIVGARKYLCPQASMMLDMAVQANADLDLLAGLIAERMPELSEDTAPNRDLKPDGREVQRTPPATPLRLSFAKVQAVMEGRRIHSLCVDADGHMHVILDDCDVTLFGLHGFNINVQEGSRAQRIIHGQFIEAGGPASGPQ